MLCQSQVGAGQGPSLCFFVAVNISPQRIHGPGLAMCSGFVLPGLPLENSGLKGPPQPLSVAAFQNVDAAGMFISLTGCEPRWTAACVCSLFFLSQRPAQPFLF